MRLMARKRGCISAAGAVALAVVVSTGLPAAASGATVQVTRPPYSGRLVLINYFAEPGESNRLVVSESGGTVVFADSAAPVVLAGEPGGCVQHSVSEVAWAPPDAFNIGVTLGDGDDIAVIATALQQRVGVGAVDAGP